MKNVVNRASLGAKKNLIFKKIKWLLVPLVLLTLSVGNAWGDKLTITSANVQTGSYPTSEATFTLASTYTFGYLNCYNPNQNNTPSGWKAGQTIQCKKDASAYGRMYNKTSITGMTKLRFWIITPDPPTLSVYTGTSMISSTPGSGAISLPNPASGSESVTYATASKSGKTWTYGTGSVTISYYDVDVPTGNTYFYFTIGNTTTTQLYQLEIFYSSGTTVSLTNGGCDGSGGTSKGSFTMTQSSSPVTSVTTTSSAQTVDITCTPADGYETSSVSATDPATHPGSITYGGSGNNRTVTYPTGHNGSSTITVTFSCVTPTISVHPASKTDYTVGDAGTALSVTASANNADLGYQWQVSNDNSAWSNIASGDGGTAATYTPSTAAAGTKYYRVIVSNAATGCSTTATSNAATITVAAASNFTNGETVFIQADSKDYSAWKDDACVKAYFNTSGSGGSAVTTYWLFDATDTDAGKKLFAAVVPSSGLNQVQLQRFASNCSDWWNANGTVTKASSGGVNTFRSYGSADNNVSWNGSSTTLYLYGSQNSWASSLGTFADQGSGVWTATISNYAPDATSKDYKIKTSYNNGWIGNTGSNSNATLSGMKVGSTYNVTATLNVTTHALTMSKTFVKGTVSFDLQGHGSAISDLTNITAGSKISAPATPTDGSYVFGGWYKEAGCVNAWDFANDVVNETMTLYAKWYQVTLVVKDEDGTTLSGDGKPTLTRSGSSLTATEAGNYAFKTIAITSGTGTLSAVSSSTTIATISSDITITATFWNARTVTKGTGTGTGTFTISASTVKYNTSVTVTCAAADGYKNPWTITITPADGATVASSTGSSGSITVSNITKNITIDLAYTNRGCTDHGASSITSGSSNNYTDAPINNFYKYGVRQILYTKEDLSLTTGKKGTIKSISFKYKYSSAMTKKTNVKIYMANTSLSSLSNSAGSYVPFSEFTEVYSGALNCSGDGEWNEFILSTPFVYYSNKNLVVMIDDNSGQYDGSSYVFYVHSASGKQIYNTSDGSHPDPSAAATWTGSTTSSNRPHTDFCLQEGDMSQYTVTWHVGESTSTTSNVYEGTTFSSLSGSQPAHADNALAACGSTKFIGWVSADGEWNEDGKTVAWYNTYKVADNYQISGNTDFYAMYAESSGSGSTTKSYGWESSEPDASYWTIGSQPSQSSTYHATGSYSGYINTNHTYVTFNEKVNVTNFSFKFTRATDNSNYNVYIETSTNNSDWSAVETYAMSDFNSDGTFKTKSKTFDGNTALYVRFHCYNTTAARYVDDVSITYSSISYSNYRTGCTVTCSRPTPAAAASISKTGATISWTDPATSGTLDHYEYKVWADGEDEPVSGTTNGTNLSKALTGLYSGVTYHWKVRRVCSGEDASIWAAGSDFTTTDAAITFSVPTGVDPIDASTTASNLPEADVPTDCGDCWAFVGWTTAAYAESSSAPATLFPAGTKAKVSGDATLYAVYTKSTYRIISALSEIDADEYYVISVSQTGVTSAMGNTVTETYFATEDEMPIKEDNTGAYIESPDEDAVWKFTGTTSAGRFQNVGNDKYMDLSDYELPPLADATSDFVNITVLNASAKTFDIESNTTDGNYLQLYSKGWGVDDEHDGYFSCRLFKRAGSTYTTELSCPKYTVTWDINNGATTSTTNVTKCDGYLASLPSDPADNTLDACIGSGKGVFMGWSPNKVMPAQDEIPEGMFDDVDDSPEITGNVRFYAVFAEEHSGGTGAVNKTFTFTSKAWADSENAWTSGSDGYAKTTQGVQVTKGATGANATTKDSYEAVTKVTVTYSTNASSGAGSIDIKVNGTSYSGSASVSNSGGTTDRTIDFTPPSSALDGAVKITVSCSTSSVYIKSVRIFYTGSTTTYDGYRTACCDDPQLTFGTIASPVTEYVIVREDLASASAGVEIDCNFESNNTSEDITWYSTHRDKNDYVGAYTWTSSQPTDRLEIDIDPTNMKIIAKETGSWQITIAQAMGSTNYCDETATVNVLVKTVDKFIDAVNGNFSGEAQRLEDTGNGITLPTAETFSTNDGCADGTTRRLLGWIKASDLATYASGRRVDMIDDLKTSDPATNKVIAPGTKVQATGVTWYAVWGVEK